MANRSIIIAGNWKMNKTPLAARTLADEVVAACRDAACGVVLCVPYVDLAQVVEATAGSKIGVGAQNVHWAASGAFTGEISAEMLTACGVGYVVIGHSERRQYFGETDETVNARTRAALDEKLRVILCVGETEAEREEGRTEAVISEQIAKDLAGISAEQMKDVIIAYEPVWAIGTGKTATALQAQEVCAFIRSLLRDAYSDEVAAGVTIQYGGSMKPENAAELLAMEDIDGGLIGGASLKCADFAAIVAAGSAAQNA